MKKGLMMMIAAATIGATALMTSGSLLQAEGDPSVEGYYGTVSEEELQIIKSKTTLLVTEHGEFVRVDEAPIVPKNEIAQSKKEINTNTKVVVLEYGVFVKKQ